MICWQILKFSEIIVKADFVPLISSVTSWAAASGSWDATVLQPLGRNYGQASGTQLCYSIWDPNVLQPLDTTVLIQPLERYCAAAGTLLCSLWDATVMQALGHNCPTACETQQCFRRQNPPVLYCNPKQLTPSVQKTSKRDPHNHFPPTLFLPTTLWKFSPIRNLPLTPESVRGKEKRASGERQRDGGREREGERKERVVGQYVWEGMKEREGWGLSLVPEEISFIWIKITTKFRP